ncbi:unnamed protein product [Effrenium voratum]|nr:unnamed protein product [Effrenium voratum]
MKLHVDTAFNSSRSFSCADEAPRIVDGMASDLEKSYGYNSMFYKGCLKFVGHHGNLSMPVITQIETFGRVCKLGLFEGNESSLGSVDPSKLAAECDRVVYNMDVQFRLLGGESLSSPQGFCAVLIDLVLPIDEEPECMRYVEDISHAHFEFLGTKHVWPGIMHEQHFDQAFMTACLEETKLHNEETGQDALFGVGADECELTLERLVKIPLADFHNLTGFLAEVCPILGKPLPVLTEPPEPTYVSTTRALSAALFHRAAHFSHQRSQWSNSSVALAAPRKKGFSALSMHLDRSVAGKGGRRRRRRRRRLNHRQSTCCDGNARTYEIGVTAAMGIAIGTSAIAVEGYNRWSGNHCEYKWGQLQEVCGGVQIGAGIDVTVAHGYFYSFSNTKGECYFAGASVCFFVCIGGEFLFDKASGKEIGKSLETGGGFGASVSGGWCHAWDIWQKGQWQRNLKGKCPSSGGGCFPSHALVRTPQGLKTMRDLRAGDRVLAADSKGNLIFDEVYFFGHAEEQWAPYVKLQLSPSNTSELELSPDHFLHVCLTLPCTWASARSMYASDVKTGNYVWTVSGTSSRLSQVMAIAMVPRLGLYNPYTLSGNIVVNDVVASAHSSWILDELAGPRFRQYLPSFYQAAFLPGRCIYAVFGPRAADWLGVSNPQGPSQRLALAAAFGPSIVLAILILNLLKFRLPKK